MEGKVNSTHWLKCLLDVVVVVAAVVVFFAENMMNTVNSLKLS